MSTTSTVTSDMSIGDLSGRQPLLWLSPLLIGLAAPVVAGLVLFPELLRDAVGMVALLLGAILLVAIGAYIISIMAPGTPAGLVVHTDRRSIAVLMRGPLAQREVVVPFKAVARLAVVKSFDHDGYELSAVELKNRDGDTWIIPCDADEQKLAQLRALVGLKPRTR